MRVMVQGHNHSDSIQSSSFHLCFRRAINLENEPVFITDGTT